MYILYVQHFLWFYCCIHPLCMYCIQEDPINCVHTDEPLPEEQKALLKWKMSPITPNVVKRCIDRVGFTRLKSTHVHCICSVLWLQLT